MFEVIKAHLEKAVGDADSRHYRNRVDDLSHLSGSGRVWTEHGVVRERQAGH